MAGVKRTFHYNACAHVFSGQFNRPIQHDIEVQAPVSLPTIGGHGNARVENFRVKEFASFKAGYSHVSGSEHVDGDKTFYTTLSTATVEGLNILDVITADRLVSRVSSFWTNKDDEPHFSFSGSAFDNLRIAGCPIHVEIKSKLISELPRFSDVGKELANNEKFRKMAQDSFPDGGFDITKHNGVIFCSLATDLAAEAPGVTAKGHVITVPHFGKVYLAEVLIEHFRRTLTMIRLELGSPVGGSGVVAQSGSNGRTYPPPPPPPLSA
ncbi:MAG TPA: choice-of-anchor P family protein [Candidatus Acidoferrum sp.]|nr:choice-of-anchor P family protein [Candidatus Acidoferrum sp.]